MKNDSQVERADASPAALAGPAAVAEVSESGGAPVSTPGTGQVATAPALEPPEEALTRRGRPPGHPKSGGRVKGTPNKTPALARALADKASADAMKLLVSVMRGERIAHKGKWWEPEPHQRLTAAQTILKKSVPDVQTVRHSGPQGEPIAVNIILGVYRADATP